MTTRTGRARFLAACRKQGLEMRPYGLKAPCTGAVDVDVAAFLEESGGGRYWALRFEPPGQLAEESARQPIGRPDLPWLRELTFFAGWQGLYYKLASIPALADRQGRQPVLYVDLYETTQIVAIASSGDRAFARLALHLERHAARGRNPDQDEPFFPESVADAIARDRELQVLIESGQLDRYRAPPRPE